MRCLGRIHAFRRPMGAFAHGYYTSGCARSHCPASQMWIRSGSATWRRQCHRNWTHPLTTPKQQTCQWERRWMIFFYRPKCSYRFIFFLRVETSAPGLSGYYWYTWRYLVLCVTCSITSISSISISHYQLQCLSKFDFSWHSLDKQMHTSLLQFVQAAGWCRQHHGYFMSYPAGRIYPAGAASPCWEPNLHMQRESIAGSEVVCPSQQWLAIDPEETRVLQPETTVALRSQFCHRQLPWIPLKQDKKFEHASLPVKRHCCPSNMWQR